MKLYISARGIKRLLLSSSAAAVDGGKDGDGGIGEITKGKRGLVAAAAGRGGGGRRMYWRTVVLLVLLMLSLLVPFVFVRVAFLFLESAALCSSSLDCLGFRFLGGSDAILVIEEMTKAMVETSKLDDKAEEEAKLSTLLVAESFKKLVMDVTSTTSSSRQEDFKAFAFKTKAMLAGMEQRVKSARRQEYMYWHLASHGVPKSLQCLSLLLAEEYAINVLARSQSPPPEYFYRLTDPSFHHVVLLTDNVLAASVVISSAVKSSTNREKLVFHVITDRKTYASMHAWFAVNNIDSAVVEIKGLHQYDWSHDVNDGVKEMLEIHRLIWNRKIVHLNEEDFEDQKDFEKNLEVLSPSFVSLLNHLRIYIPELFPDLHRVVFFDDDVVVQHDLSPLWELDLNGKVVGAVVDSWCGHGCCPGRKFNNYFNFTNTIISSKLDKDQCGWLYGMNIFDLEAWRKTNITRTYHQWLNISLNSCFTLWHPGAFPPALLAFEGHVHPINSSWHVSGLGHRSPVLDKNILETAAVVHYSGPAKPWLEISDPEVRSLWLRHVNSSNRFIRQCEIVS